MYFTRYNAAAKTLELSTDGGSSWATLPLTAAQIGYGTFDTARIPSLAASIITSGVFNAAQIPAIVDSMVDGAAAIAWSKISKTSSSLANLATRSASDLNAGTLGATLYADFVASGGSHAKGAVPDPGAAAGTTKFLREDATWQIPAPQIQLVRQTADVTKNNNTTLANLTGLVFTIPASQTWLFIAPLYLISPIPGYAKYGVVVPSGATGRFGVVPILGTAASSAALSSTIAMTTSGYDQGAFVYGLVINSTNAGTVQLQFAQYTATVGNSIVYTNSTLFAMRLA